MRPARQSLRCSHTWSMEVDKGSDQKWDYPQWMTAHAHLKYEFTEDEKYHNLIRWLILFIQKKRKQEKYRAGKQPAWPLRLANCPFLVNSFNSYEPRHDKTNKMALVPSEASAPPSLIRVFAVHLKKAWVLSYPLSAQRRLWSDWADAQTLIRLGGWPGWSESSLGAHSFRWFCHVVPQFRYNPFIISHYMWLIYLLICLLIIAKYEYSETYLLHCKWK